MRIKAVTVPDRLANSHDFTYKFLGTTIYSTLDLLRAYHQVPVEEEDIQKIAVGTPFGLYEFPYMTFGPFFQHFIFVNRFRNQNTL